jgi:prolyl 4-hydroxylase
VARHEKPGAQLLSQKPVIAEFPGFFSPSEADELVSVARKLGWEEAWKGEGQLPKEVRDVQKVDCSDHRCLFHPFVGEVHRRVAELLAIPPYNFESLEFLSYGPGQHYSVHPDAVESFGLEPLGRGSGLRILTAFLYLSDVKKGGETEFPKAGVSVKPRKGKLVVWANVNNNLQTVADHSWHLSKPVIKGHKFAANFWVHPHDFRFPEMHAPWWC